MSGELSFTEIDRQDAELLPPRTVMSVVMSQPTGGTNTGGSASGPSDFVKSCVASFPTASTQNCQSLETFFASLFPSPTTK